MFVLVLVLLLLIASIVLGQLNTQTIDFNFFGIMLHGVPLSVLLLICLLVGVILTYLSFTIKNLILKNKLEHERKEVQALSQREIKLKNELKALEAKVSAKENLFECIEEKEAANDEKEQQ